LGDQIFGLLQQILEDLLQQAENLVAQGQPVQGRILLENVRDGALPPDLLGRAQTLADKLESPPANPTAKPVKP
jgi:hypothetical protein